MTSSLAPASPVFSVIVPTHGRPEQVSRCLSALAASGFSREHFEVLIVDDGRTLNPAQCEALCSSAAGLQVSIVGQDQSGPAAARNAGALRARGRYLAFTDDDCLPAADWLARLEGHLQAEPDALVGGFTRNALPAVPFSTASQLLIDYLYSYYHVEQTGARFFTTNNMAMDAAAFRALGGFDGSFPLAAGEDREFCERWQRSGRPLRYAEDAVVSHAHHLDFSGFVRQHFNYGRGADFLHRSRAIAEGRPSRPRLEPMGFYLNLLRYPLTRGRSWRAIRLAALMCVSQAAYGFGYLLQRLRHRWAPPGPPRLLPETDQGQAQTSVPKPERPRSA
jgi:GT2 family glycosyltransferase